MIRRFFSITAYMLVVGLCSTVGLCFAETGGRVEPRLNPEKIEVYPGCCRFVLVLTDKGYRPTDKVMISSKRALTDSEDETMGFLEVKPKSNHASWRQTWMPEMPPDKHYFEVQLEKCRLNFVDMELQNYARYCYRIYNGYNLTISRTTSMGETIKSESVNIPTFYCLPDVRDWLLHEQVFKPISITATSAEIEIRKPPSKCVRGSTEIAFLPVQYKITTEQTDDKFRDQSNSPIVYEEYKETSDNRFVVQLNNLTAETVYYFSVAMRVGYLNVSNASNLNNLWGGAIWYFTTDFAPVAYAPSLVKPKLITTWGSIKGGTK